MSGKAHLLLVLLTVGLVGFVLHLVRAGRLRAKYAMLWSTVGAGLVVLEEMVLPRRDRASRRGRRGIRRSGA